jgi:hypothetical protein
MRLYIVKPKTHNQRLEPLGLAKPGKSCGLMGKGPGLAPQAVEGRVFGRVWNRAVPFSRSKPGLLGGYPHLLLKLALKLNSSVLS